MLLSPRFSIPKMKYKGVTVQWQRVKAKRGPKIQEVELTDAERAELEKKGLEEQKIKDLPSEMIPTWQFYCDLDGDPRLVTKSHWLQTVATQFEA